MSYLNLRRWKKTIQSDKKMLKFVEEKHSGEKTCFSKQLTKRKVGLVCQRAVEYIIEMFRAFSVARGHSGYKLTKLVRFYSSISKSSYQVH